MSGVSNNNRYDDDGINDGGNGEYLAEDGVPRILPPTDDRVFKSIMTTSLDSLRDLITCLIKLPVSTVELRNAELPTMTTCEKMERFDVNCSIDDGTQVEVEMQASAMKYDSADNRHENVKCRAIYNLCDLHAKQDGKGKVYKDFVRSFQVTICDYTVYPEYDEFVIPYTFRNDWGDELLDMVCIIFVELSKAAKLKNKPVETMTPLEKWLIYLHYANQPKYQELINNITESRKEIKMAQNILDNISRNEDERFLYRERRKAEQDYEHGIVGARMEGRMEGRIEGEMEGMIKLARKHLGVYATIEQIANFAELPYDDVAKYIERINNN
ncbi:MAG: Rpn family recombination-promoting nuclease/putative transposase [Planctomycetaceae bacterium]|jgi:predicted transposase/invertase (TIGR01784 family)|nr:Rpn family recombination-promoting nuclease/putative transposase [Planctomycetaceae bacterium]